MSELTVLKGSQLSVPNALLDKLRAASQSVIVETGTKIFPRISPARMRFSILEKDADPFLIVGEDNKPVDYIDVVILGGNPGEYRTFYEGKYDPKAQEKAAPICWSATGAKPHPRSEKPQAKTCADCPHNVWGSRITENGGKARACGSSKRILAVSAAAIGGPVYMMNCAYQASTNLTKYTKHLDKMGYPLPAVVTRVGLDEDSTVPVLTFKEVSGLSEQQLNTIVARLDEDDVAEFMKGEYDSESEANRKVIDEPEAPVVASPKEEPKQQDKPAAARGFGAAPSAPKETPKPEFVADGAPDVSDVMDF